MSVEQYEAAVSSIVASNHCNPQDGESLEQACNPQGGEDDFNRDVDYMKAAVSDLSVGYDEALFSEAIVS